MIENQDTDSSPVEAQDLAVMDENVALARALDDEELLAELVELFVADAPTILNEIREATTARDSERLSRSAHAIKGSASNLSAGPVSDAALVLEMIGRSKDLSNVESALVVLEYEIERLTANLTQMLEVNNAGINS